MPKPFAKQYFATASGDFKSVASFNSCTKCLSLPCLWQSPGQPWSLVAAHEEPGVCGGSEAISGNRFQLGLRDPSSSVRKERLKCCLAEPESPCLKVSLLSPPSGLKTLSALCGAILGQVQACSLQVCSAGTGAHVLRFPSCCH